MPSGSLAGIHVALNALCKRICREKAAVFEGTDQACLVDQDLLSAVIGNPLQECLGSVNIAIAVNRPEAGRAGNDGINAILECVRRKAHCPAGVIGAARDTAVDPVALRDKGILACGKTGHLVIIGAVDQKGGIGILVHHTDKCSEIFHPCLVDLAAVIEQIDVGGVILCKACIQILRKNVRAGGPAQIRRLRAPAEHCGQTELVFFAVESLNCLLPCCGACQRSGVHTCLLQNLRIVSQRGCLNRIRESDRTHFFVDQLVIGIFRPRLTRQISEKAVPVRRLVCLNDENIGHVVCLIHLLEFVGSVGVTADGLYADNFSCLFLILCSQVFKLSINFGLAVQKTDALSACSARSFPGACRRTGRRTAAGHEADCHCSSQHNC